MKRAVPDDAILIPEKAKKVFSGVLFDVFHWEQELFDGSKTTYELLRRPDTAQLICIDEDQIILIEEIQAGRPKFIRMPGGRVEEGEGWQEAGERECLEELGLKFKNWQLIDVTQPVSKIQWFVGTMIATDVIERRKPDPDSGEKIDVEKLSLEDLKKRVNGPLNPPLRYIKHITDSIETIEQLKNLPEYSSNTFID